jgi:hypothetical protein
VADAAVIGVPDAEAGEIPKAFVVLKGTVTGGELMAYGKANPGKINYAFVPGTVGHITTELFARTAGIELTKIPYKGNGDALANLIGGHVSMMFLSIAPIIGNVKGGKLHALAVGRATDDAPNVAASFVAAWRYRTDWNAARSSAANSSGYSHIAKWPPWPTSLK